MKTSAKQPSESPYEDSELVLLSTSMDMAGEVGWLPDLLLMGVISPWCCQPDVISCLILSSGGQCQPMGLYKFVDVYRWVSSS